MNFLLGKIPRWINLAIGNKCYIKCLGCYSLVGNKEPDLGAFIKSMTILRKLGVTGVTISGGDPLLIDQIEIFLKEIKSLGFSIKFDTVGIGFKNYTDSKLGDFLDLIDTMGLPLDGWNNSSVRYFRKGNKVLFDETLSLLHRLNVFNSNVELVINTVVNNMNYTSLSNIYSIIKQFQNISYWNLHQYTKTDLVLDRFNEQFYVSNYLFDEIKTISKFDESHIGINFQGNTERLNEYFLVNSEGVVWLPDSDGETVVLGNLLGNEEQMIEKWIHYINKPR